LTWTAILRRGTQFPYMNFLNVLLLIFRKTEVATLAKRVVAMVWAALSVLAGRAMVAGMAMASVAALLPNWGYADGRWAIKVWLGVSGKAIGKWALLGYVGMVTMSYTPLHTTLWDMVASTYGLIVWGSTPRWTRAGPSLDLRLRTPAIGHAFSRKVPQEELYMDFQYVVVVICCTAYGGGAPSPRRIAKIGIDLV
jgi:hypothetical protein